MDFEISKPFPTTGSLEGYGFVQFLIRLHGNPIGYIKIPVTNQSVSALATRQEVLKKYSWKIIRLLLIQGLKGGAWTTGKIDFERLLKPSKLDPPTTSMPLVTVAVCTRDRSEELPLCLDSLSSLEYPNLDILILDNAPSSDDTQELVSDRYPHMRYVREPRPGLDWARNRAILEARGDIIAFTDDDVIVDPGWITALVTVFAENPQVMAVTGMVVPYELETEAQEFFELYGGFNRGFNRYWIRANTKSGKAITSEFAGTGRFGTGANMSFRRSLFEKTGYFDPALDVGTVTNGGGDLEMFFRVLKKGYTLVYEPRAVVRHRHRRDHLSLRRQINDWGIGFSAYLFSCFLAYPNERWALARWYPWYVYYRFRRLLRLLLRQSRLRALAWAELKGLFIGPWRYIRARATAREIERNIESLYYPLGKGNLPGQKISSTQRSITTAVRRVDISQPLQEITEVSAYDKVRAFVNHGDLPIGSFDIPTLEQSISVTRMLDFMMDNLSNQLFLKYGDTLWAEATCAVGQHLSESGGSDKNENFIPLPDHYTVSIIVATYDRPQDLKNCLDALMNLRSTRQKEIIVVDNNPESGLTSRVVKSYPGVILIKERRKGSSYARNTGIIQSTGDIVIFIDDDVTVTPEWLERLIAPFARNKVMAVTGNVLPLELETEAQHLYEIYGGLGRGFEEWEADRAWFEGFTRRSVPTWLLGGTANLACRANIFADPNIGMFDEALGAGTPTGTGEDIYFFYKTLKAGYIIAYEPKAYVFHRHRRDMADLRRQIYHYSRGHVAYHLTTLVNDFDLRALLTLFLHLPKYRIKQLLKQLWFRNQYPLLMILVEIAGNLAGPWGFWRSRRRVRRLGSNSAYIPVSERPSFKIT